MTKQEQLAYDINNLNNERVKWAMEVGRLRAQLAHAERQLDEATDHELRDARLLLRTEATKP